MQRHEHLTKSTITNQLDLCRLAYSQPSSSFCRSTTSQNELPLTKKVCQIQFQSPGDAILHFFCQFYKTIIARRGALKSLSFPLPGIKSGRWLGPSRDAEEKLARWLAAAVRDELFSSCLVVVGCDGATVLSGALINKQCELRASFGALGGGGGRCKQRMVGYWGSTISSQTVCQAPIICETCGKETYERPIERENSVHSVNVELLDCSGIERIVFGEYI